MMSSLGVDKLLGGFSGGSKILVRQPTASAHKTHASLPHHRCTQSSAAAGFACRRAPVNLQPPAITFAESEAEQCLICAGRVDRNRCGRGICCGSTTKP